MKAFAAAEAGGGDDDGTTGIVDCVVATANAVAGGFDLSEKCVGFRKHKERGESYSNRRESLDLNRRPLTTIVIQIVV